MTRVVLKIGAALCALGAVYSFWLLCSMAGLEREGRIVGMNIHPQLGYTISVDDGVAVIGGPISKQIYRRAVPGDTIRYGAYHDELIRDGRRIAVALNQGTRVFLVLWVIMLFPLVIFMSPSRHPAVHSRGMHVCIGFVELLAFTLLLRLILG
jgi:hypothetical protein